MKIDYDKLLKISAKDRKQATPEMNEMIEENEIFYSISKIIIQYRKDHNLTQADLAKKMKMNQTMISKIESGRYNPTFKQIHKISRKLTNSAEMFKDTLREILRNIENIEYITKVTITSKTENEYKIENYYMSQEKGNIIYIKDYYSNNKGEKNNGEYQSRYTIVG